LSVSKVIVLAAHSFVVACLGVLISCALFDRCRAQAVGGAHVATYKLGFSGATVSIREDIGRSAWPIARQTFILAGANGRTRKFPLHEGGGAAGNDSLNLFWVAQDKYFLTSERDCVEFDPVSVQASECLRRPPCENGVVRGLTYLGRFDWMNGFDPPKGVFRFDFRFLPFMDAAESGSCTRP
jgi:hypothetical protein